MTRARHLVYGAIVAVALGVALVVGLAIAEPALGVVVAIMLIGLAVLFVPPAFQIYDERQAKRLRH